MANQYNYPQQRQSNSRKYRKNRKKNNYQYNQSNQYDQYDQYQQPQQQYQYNQPSQYNQYNKYQQQPYQSNQRHQSKKYNKSNQYNQYQQQQQYHDNTNQVNQASNINNQNKNKNKNKLITIDGSMMEGGGQILRNSMALSALLHKAVQIKNIRGKRRNPGLRKQHSKGIELIQNINGGTLEGNYVKSMQIKYYPQNKSLYLDNFYIDIETAGSICLLLQTSIPLLLYSSSASTLTIIGGTNASFAPQIDYFQLILKPMLSKLMDIDIDIKCMKRGFYPRGGGKVILNISPINYIKPFNLTNRGYISSISGNIVIGGNDIPLSSSKHILSGIKKEFRIKLNKNNNIPININIVPKDASGSLSSGIGVVLCIETNTGCLFGGSSLSDGYNRKNQNYVQFYEEIGRIAARDLLYDWYSTSSGCTDRWLQDQLIIFMALAKGKSKIKTCNLELHTKTAIYIAELLTGVKFNITNENDGAVIIECDGIGHINTNLKDNDNNDNDDNDNKDMDKNDQNNTNNNGNNYLKDRPSLF